MRLKQGSQIRLYIQYSVEMDVCMCRIVKGARNILLVGPTTYLIGMDMERLTIIR